MSDMDKQQVIALVAAVAMLVTVLLDGTFTYGELPASQVPARAAGPDTATPPAAERVVAQADVA